MARWVTTSFVDLCSPSSQCLKWSRLRSGCLLFSAAKDPSSSVQKWVDSRFVTLYTGSMPLVAAFGLALAWATAGPQGSADEEIQALLAAGEIARAEELANAAIDRESADPERDPAAIAEHLDQLAMRFYDTSTAEGVAAAERLFVRQLSLREALAAKEPEPLAILLHALSSLYFDRGDYEEAEAAERRALEIRERIHAPADPRTAESRRDLGLIFAAQGRLREAEAELLPALEVIEASPSVKWVDLARGRSYLAELYRLQGRYGEAAAVLEDLVRQAPEKLGTDAPEFPQLLNNLAGIYRDQGRYDEVETLLRRSLALRESAAHRDNNALARAKLNLAELYRWQGKLDEAEALYGEALGLARKALGPGSPELFEFINQLAVLHREQGRLAKAEQQFREALVLVERGLGPDHPRVAQSRLDLAELLRDRRKCEAAEPHYRRATEIREQALGPEHPDVAEVLVAHARCLATTRAGRAEARASLDRAVAILGRSEAHQDVAVDALKQRAELTHAQDPEGARRDLTEAVRTVEAMRPHRGGGEGVRAEFFGHYASLYEHLVRWEIEAGQPELALGTTERGRARSLLDQLAAAHVGETARPDPEIERRQAALRAELAEVRERLAFEAARTDLSAAERQGRVTALEQRREQASRAFRELYDEARNESAAWRGAVAGEPATAAEIQTDVVPRDGLLLEYDIGAERSSLFVVPPAPGAVEAMALTIAPDVAARLGVPAGPLTEAALAEVVGKILGEITAPGGALARGIGGLSSSRPSFDDTRLHLLWRVLIPAGLWARLARAPQVLVVPDGALFLLPLEALVVAPAPDLRATRFWLDVGPVVRYAPSATFVRQLRSREPPRRSGRSAALTVADPVGARLATGVRLARLPGTAAESRAVRAALEPVADVVLLDGEAARESAVRREIGDKRYIHIATHGLVEQEGSALFAALALTPPPAGVARGDDDGLLQLFEIYDLRLTSELAVLSACSSNTGRVVASEGIFALSRGFLVAGSQSVVASQWSVDDASTAELVADLFRRLAAAEQAGSAIDPARALRDAKLRVRSAKPEWAHPFFWAPFAFTGPSPGTFSPMTVSVPGIAEPDGPHAHEPRMPDTISSATATPIRLSPAIRPEPTGTDEARGERRPRAGAGARRRGRRGTSRSRCCPGCTIAMPSPDGDGTHGLQRGSGAKRSSSAQRDAEQRGRRRSPSCAAPPSAPMPSAKAFDTPAQTRHDGAGHASRAEHRGIGDQQVERRHDDDRARRRRRRAARRTARAGSPPSSQPVFSVVSRSAACRPMPPVTFAAMMLPERLPGRHARRRRAASPGRAPWSASRRSRR